MEETIVSLAGVAELTEFSTLEGEASASNRKRKLIFFYEWDLKIKWKGTLNTESMDNVTGTISIPNLSDEQDISDIDVSVTVSEEKAGSQNIKDMIRTHGADLIREKLSDYIIQLKQEFSQGMILPANPNQPQKADNIPASISAAAGAKLAEEFRSSSSISSVIMNTKPAATVAGVGGVKIETKKLSMKENFMCSKEELYRGLTERDMVQAFTRAPVATWELEVGGRFSLFDGMICGEFQQLVPNECVIQRWRMKSWPEGHYSTVTIKLEQGSSCTTLTLSQTGVPSAEVDRTKSGWSNYYWNSIRQTFGYAVNIF